MRELEAGEVASLQRGKSPAVKVYRDSHHMVARLFATGLRPGAVAARVGYSLGRVSTLYADPAFKELIASYRDSVDEEWKESVDEYFETVAANRTIAARLINDKLSDADHSDVSFRELVAIHGDAADRTGYPKRSVAVNVNVDFAARLDQAIKRSAGARPTLTIIDGDLANQGSLAVTPTSQAKSSEGAREVASSPRLEPQRVTISRRF